MFISIIAVVRNNPSVAATVASVLAQKGVKAESIVIDGASTATPWRPLSPLGATAA